MAAEPKEPLKTKAEILSELALSRQALSADLPELACRCNPAARLRRSIASHPTAWIAASSVAGLVATKLLLSKRGAESTGDAEHRSGARFLPLIAFLLKNTWSVARPTAEKILRERVASLAGEDPKETA